MGRSRPCALPILVAGALLLGACDLPTRLPKGWDTEFQVEVEGVTLPVRQLLPSSVALTPDGSAFSLFLGPASLGESLGNLCPECAASQGLTIPKPAFQGSFGSEIALPADVDAVTLEGGRVRVAITSGLNFDPLRPGGEARGTLTITLRSGLTPLGPPRVVDGHTRALPPGSTLSEEIEIGPATLSAPITVTVAVDSPLGAPVRMEPATRLSALALPSGMRASSANVGVGGRQIGSEPGHLDLTDLDDVLSGRVRRGALLLHVENPFNVFGTITVGFTGPGVSIVKPLELRTGSQAHEIPLTGTELRTMIGTRMTVRVSGAVWSRAGGVTVRPSQVLSVSSKIHLVVGPKD
jgi:hypothetical protein